MNRLAQRSNWVEEIVGLLASGDPGQKRWFSRRVKELTDGDRTTVLLAAQERYGDLPYLRQFTETETEAPNDDTQVFWSDAEHARLAALIWEQRRKHPGTSLVKLANRVMPQLPTDRRKEVKSRVELKPLLEHLQRLDQNAADDAACATDLRKQLDDVTAQLKAKPDRAEVIGTMTDQEVMEHFKERVLGTMSPEDVVRHYGIDALLAGFDVPDLIGLMAKTCAAEFLSMSSGFAALPAVLQRLSEAGAPTAVHVNGSPQATRRKIKVAIVGLVAAQQHTVRQQVSVNDYQLSFYDNDHAANWQPGSHDMTVVVARFVSRRMLERVANSGVAHVVHRGGLRGLINRFQATGVSTAAG